VKLQAQADRHEVLIDRQEKQIARMQTMMDQLHESNRVLRDENAECQAEQESLWVWLQTFYRIAVNQTRVLKTLGHEVDDLPPMPERKDTRARAEYESRRIEHNTNLVQTLRPKTPVPEDHP
jgi:hypothetical protein